MGLNIVLMFFFSSLFHVFVSDFFIFAFQRSFPLFATFTLGLISAEPDRLLSIGKGIGCPLMWNTFKVIFSIYASYFGVTL